MKLLFYFNTQQQHFLALKFILVVIVITKFVAMFNVQHVHDMQTNVKRFQMFFLQVTKSQSE